MNASGKLPGSSGAARRSEPAGRAGSSGPPGGKGDREALRSELAGLGVPTYLIALEMRVRFGFRPRQAWRHAHGWSQDAAAREYNTRYHTDAMSRERISDYEAWPVGGRRASPGTLQRFADLYGATTAELCDAADLKATPEDDRRVINAQRRDTPTPSALTVPNRSRSVVPRPARPSRAGRRLEAEFIMAASHESFDHAVSSGQSNVQDSQLEQLHEEVFRIAANYGVVAPVESYHDMYQLREAVYTLLEEQQRPSERADLILIAGQVVGLMGHASADLGHTDAAIEQTRAAFLYGDMIGHEGLRAWACAELSIAYSDGDQVHKALRAVRRGLRVAPSGLAKARLHCLEASYAARIGHVTAARTALMTATDALEDDHRTDDIFDTSVGPFGFSHARRAQVAATTYVRLGENNDAILAATDSLTLFDCAPAGQRLFGSVAIAQISMAAGRVGLGQFDGASEALREVFALPPVNRIAPITTRLGELSGQVARRFGTEREGRALNEQIEDFVSAASPRALT